MLLEILDKLEDKSESKKIISVLTSDGKKKFKVLRALSKRYNGKGKILFIPEMSLPTKKGMIALSAIKTYLSLYYKIQNFLFIVDRDTIKIDLLTDVKRILLNEERKAIKGEESLYKL